MIRRLLFIGSFIMLVAAPASSQDPTLVVENGRVIVGDGTVIEHASVVVAGERIVTVTGEPVEAPSARRIDGAGNTVLPGLIDAHVHLLVNDPNPALGDTDYSLRVPQPYAANDSVVRAYLENDLPKKLVSILESGVTTIRSTGDYWPEILEVKARLLSGEFTGPRLEVVGPVFTARGHPSQMCRRNGQWNEWCRSHLVVQLEDPREAREAVRRVAESGVDGIKMVGPQHGGPTNPEVIRAAAAEAEERGIPALMHVYDSQDAFESLALGVDQFVHTPILGSNPTFNQRMLALMRETGTFAVSTISINDVFLESYRRSGRSEQAEAEAQKVRALKRAGRIYAEEGLLVFGTDVPMLSPQKGLHRELRLLREAGLTPAQIIRTATLTAARQLGREEELGTLEAGKLADLVVVDGDPLNDLSALQNVEVVIKGGEVVVEN